MKKNPLNNLSQFRFLDKIYCKHIIYKWVILNDKRYSNKDFRKKPIPDYQRSVFFITIFTNRINIMLALYELILNRDEKSFKRNIIAYSTSNLINSCQWVGMCFRGFLWTWFLHYRKKLSPVIGRITSAHPNLSGTATDFQWNAYPLLGTLWSSFKATCSCTWLLRNSGVTLRGETVLSSSEMSSKLQ